MLAAAEIPLGPGWVSTEFGGTANAAAETPLPAAPTLTTVRHNGPSANRVDIVFLGDGYRASDLDTDYLSHINSQLQYMFEEQQDPYPRYASFFNVHRIDVISNETGADIPPDGVFRDTALDAKYFWDGVTERLLYINDAKANAMLTAGLAGADFSAEMKMLTVNSDKYGGGGGTWAVYAGGNSSANDVALHEMAHSFSGLADEYFSTATYTGGEPSAVNVSKLATGEKWAPWLGYVDPQHPGLGPVGAFEGGMYHSRGIYRPTATSKMAVLGQPFNAVARDKIIRDIYRFVDPLDGWLDNSALVSGIDPRLSVEVVDPDVISVEWFVDGVLAVGVTGETFSPVEFGLDPGTYEIRARAYDPTDWVRMDRSQLEQTVSWNVRIDASAPELLMTVAAGDILEDGGNVTVTLNRTSFDRSQPLIVQLASGNINSVTVPASVEIPADAASATFVAQLIDNAARDGTRSVVLTASASGFADATLLLVVVDDESLPSLHNADRPFDVDGNQDIDIQDAIAVIRALRRLRSDPNSLPSSGPPYLDADDDGQVGVNDAIAVIRHLRSNREPSPTVELESLVLGPTSESTPVDWMLNPFFVFARELERGASRRRQFPGAAEPPTK